MRRQEAQSTRKTSLGSLDPIEKAVVAKFRADLSDHIADSTKHITWGIPLPYGARLWHFDGSLVSTDGTAPESGAVATLRPNEGVFGGCVAVEVGTENLHIVNPTWNSGEGLTITDLGPGDGRIWRQKIDANSPSTNRFWQYHAADIPVSASTQYTFSIYLKGDNIVSQVYLRDDSGGESVIAPIELTENWQRVSVTLTTSTTATKLTRASFLIPAGSVGTVYVGDWQIEPNPFPTSFTTGTRAAGKLEYEVTYGERGKLAWWMTGSSATTATDVFTLGTGNTITQLSGAGSKLSWSGLDCSLDISPLDWLYCAATWDRVSGDRSLTVHNLTQGVNASATATDADTLAFGSTLSYGGANLADVRYDEVMYDPLHAATPEQIQAWHNMGVPFWDPWVGQR